LFVCDRQLCNSDERLSICLASTALLTDVLGISDLRRVDQTTADDSFKII